MSFVKGDKNINRHGRPKRKKSLSEMLRLEAEKSIKLDDGEKIKKNKLLARKLFTMALEGNIYAIKEVFDRIEGKPENKVSIKNGDNEIIENLIDAFRSIKIDK